MEMQVSNVVRKFLTAELADRWHNLKAHIKKHNDEEFVGWLLDLAEGYTIASESLECVNSSPTDDNVESTNICTGNVSPSVVGDALTAPFRDSQSEAVNEDGISCIADPILYLEQKEPQVTLIQLVKPIDVQADDKCISGTSLSESDIPAVMTTTKTTRATPDSNIAKPKRLVPVTTFRKSAKQPSVRHSCPVCNTTCADARNLRQHFMIHTGEKPYQCDVCKKCFRHKFHLTRHRRIHTGERPYKCSHCAKAFSDRSSLASHAKRHTGDRRFVCDVCGAKFIQGIHLRVHARVHTKERPYLCSVCGKTFQTQSSLQRHLTTHADSKTCDSVMATWLEY